MGQTLEALYRLQQIQGKIQVIRRDLEARERAVRAQKRKVAQLDQQIAEKEQELKHFQSEMARGELDLKARDEHIGRLRQQLNTVRTNKEYSAILTQMNLDKADYVKLEEQVLARMGKLEEFKTAMAALRTQRDETQAKIAQLQKAYDARLAECSAPLGELETQREEAAGQVPPAALGTFERVLERQEGEAMARVEQPHRRRSEYICGGCNMGITVEQVNALMTRDDLQICNSCGRILFRPADDEPSAS